MKNIKDSILKYWNISLSFILLFFTFNPNLCIAGNKATKRAIRRAQKAAQNADEASTEDSGLTDAMCIIVDLLTGTVGQAVAMIALVALGIGIFLGKLSWPLALATAVGITFIFSAGTIVQWLTAGASVGC